jgi:peptide/nickel transport system permease protein
MKKYIFKRVIQAVPMLFFISLVSYIIMNLAPGDPIQAFVTPKMSVEQVEIIRHNMGLDKPVMVRYFCWLKNILKGDFGYSLINHRPVIKEIGERIPATIGLMGISMIISVMLSIPLGMLSAVKKNKFIDNFITGISYIGISIPSFWFGMILITVLSLKLKLLPSIGMHTVGVDSKWDVIKHGIMPCMVLAFPNIAVLTRYIRSNTISQLEEEYVITAVSKGLSKSRILFFHVLKNSIMPVITILGMSLPELVSGAFITETIFGWPGMGRFGINAVFNRNYSVIMAITMLTSILLILGNLLADILYCAVDPRIKVVKR